MGLCEHNSCFLNRPPSSRCEAGGAAILVGDGQEIFFGGIMVLFSQEQTNHLFVRWPPNNIRGNRWY